MKEISGEFSTRGESGFSLLELLVVIAVTALMLALLLPGLERAREAGRRSVCQSNLKEWGLIFHMYAGEGRAALFPPIQVYDRSTMNVAESFALSPWMEALYGEYLTDLAILSCPSDPDSLAVYAMDDRPERALRRHPWLSGRSYLYTGWVFDKLSAPATLAEEWSALAVLDVFLGRQVNLAGRRVSAQVAAGLEGLIRQSGALSQVPMAIQAEMDRDVKRIGLHPHTGQSLGNGATDQLFRLRLGVERFLMAEGTTGGGTWTVASDIWVMMDQCVPRGGGYVLNHAPGGANVLYLDGHVAYVPFLRSPVVVEGSIASDFGAIQPVSPSVMDTFGALAGLR